MPPHLRSPSLPLWRAIQHADWLAEDDREHLHVVGGQVGAAVQDAIDALLAPARFLGDFGVRQFSNLDVRFDALVNRWLHRHTSYLQKMTDSRKQSVTI